MQLVQTHGEAYMAAQMPSYFQRICEGRGVLEQLQEESIDESSKTTYICMLTARPLSRKTSSPSNVHHAHGVRPNLLGLADPQGGKARGCDT